MTAETVLSVLTLKLLKTYLFTLSFKFFYLFYFLSQHEMSASLFCRWTISLDHDHDDGKLFHVRGPVIGNERSPTVTNRDCGTKRISVSADDLSRRLEPMSATWWSDADRYGGARSWRQRKTYVATLKSTRSTALNQCSSIKADVTWSDHRRLKIDLAAALMTDCRRRNW